MVEDVLVDILEDGANELIGGLIEEVPIRLEGIGAPTPPSAVFIILALWLAMIGLP